MTPAFPQPRFAPIQNGRPHPPMLLSVDLDQGEEIEWIWTHPQDGPSYVSGYRRVPRLPWSARSASGSLLADVHSRVMLMSGISIPPREARHA
jgi:hypothetical protein